MKRMLTIALLFATITPAFAASHKGHGKGSHKPRHHRAITIKPIKTVSA